MRTHSSQYSPSQPGSHLKGQGSVVTPSFSAPTEQALCISHHTARQAERIPVCNTRSPRGWDERSCTGVGGHYASSHMMWPAC